MTAVGTKPTRRGVVATMTMTFQQMLSAVLVEEALLPALNLHLASMTTLLPMLSVTAAPGIVKIPRRAVLTIRLTFQRMASAADVVGVSSSLQVVAQEGAAQGAAAQEANLLTAPMITQQATQVATTAPGMMSTHKDVECMMTTTLLPLSNAASVEAAWLVEENA